MTTNNPNLGMTPNRSNRRGLSAAASDPVRTDVQQEENRQLNVAVPVQMHRQIRVLAAQEGITVRDWCIMALTAYIDKKVNRLAVLQSVI